VSPGHNISRRPQKINTPLLNTAVIHHDGLLKAARHSGVESEGIFRHALMPKGVALPFPISYCAPRPNSFRRHDHHETVLHQRLIMDDDDIKQALDEASQPQRLDLTSADCKELRAAMVKVMALDPTGATVFAIAHESRSTLISPRFSANA